MNHSIPNVIQNPLNCEDNLVTHATHSSKALGHDLVEFTIGHNFFPRSSSVGDINGKWKLVQEKDTSPRECANSCQSKGGGTVLQNKKIMSELARIKEYLTQD